MSEYAAYDVQLIWDGTVVGQVRDISGPATTADAIDVTTRDGGGEDEYIGGLKDGGEVTFDVIYDPDLATQTVLLTAISNGTIALAELRTLLVDTDHPTGLRFFAQVGAFTPKAPMRDALTADVVCRLMAPLAEIDYLVDELANYLVDHSGNYLIA